VIQSDEQGHEGKWEEKREGFHLEFSRFVPSTFFVARWGVEGWKSGKFDLLGFFLAHAHVSSPFSIRGDGTQGEVRSHGSHAANAQNDLSVHGATQFIKQLTLAANVVLYVVEAEMENNL
jgi:hypothetical protein